MYVSNGCRKSTLGFLEPTKTYNVWLSKDGIEKFINLAHNKFVRIAQTKLQTKLTSNDIQIEMDPEIMKCLQSAVYGKHASSLTPIPDYIEEALHVTILLLEGRVRMRWRMQISKQQIPMSHNACNTREEVNQLEHRLSDKKSTEYEKYLNMVRTNRVSNT